MKDGREKLQSAPHPDLGGIGAALREAYKNDMVMDDQMKRLVEALKHIEARGEKKGGKA